ncbi:MAG: AAA family ATPase [Bacilli bacterium]|nr:AAA family ATPase [Bacilli bacterium]
MKLISIKAHGFKSFADKIEINIKDGITGIVGPNGSGKSNIVDAVKWVLGEQSIKNLRGSQNMSDVIFQGSNSRKPMSRAWVSLTFDNNDHYLKSEFDTVEIKRVVYSTGENEYFINNAKVRLKDIIELFMDTGSSTNSFSIISQGKISEILSGKPLDRRTIIEEAAGVLKYKKHKEETLRKIEKANDNIDKIDLVIKELENSLEPLKQQRDDAIKYKKLKSENDELDIVLTAIDIKASEQELNKLKQVVKELQEEINRIDNTSIKDTSKLERLKLTNTNLDTKINELNEELINLNKEISETEAEKQISLERKKYKVDDIKLQDNIVHLKEKELSINKDIDVLNNTISELKIDLENITDKINKNNIEYKKVIEEKNNILDNLNKKNLNIVKLKNKITILENNLSNDTSIPSSVKNILNSKSLKGIHNIVGKVIDSDIKYKDSLNVALGYNANVIIIDNEECSKKAIEYLKTNKLGRCTFFPLNIIKEKKVDNNTLDICNKHNGFINTLDKLVTYDEIYTNIIKNILGNVLVVDNIDSMNKLGKSINYSYRIVTLDGEILHTGGSLTGGSLNKNNNTLLDKFELESSKNELNTILNEEKTLEEKLNKIEEKILEFNNIRNDITNKYNETNSLLNIKNNNLNDLINTKNNIESEIKGNNNLLNNAIDESLDNLLNKYYKLTSDKEILLSNISKLKSEKNDCLSEINEIELSNKKINTNYNKLVIELKNNELELNKYELKMDNLLIKLNEEYSMTYEYVIKNYDLSIDEKSSLSRLNTIKRELSLLNNVNLGSIDEYERINERFEFLTSQKLDIVNSINNLMEVITDLDNTMIEKFKDTFDKVNIEFNKVFKKLFKGGVGELKLTEPEDLLNTGIDITACPPGKTLKSINLLSGGEKTLTAIALLFAILNIRYVPFCILDEVEAALDEANVDMFGNYISDYKDKTEFIIITHKKRTMEYANTLYGITMQESGVSKLVSVKLDDIK